MVRAERKNRNEAIDLGRVLGSVAVIAAHIAPGDIWTEKVATVSIFCHVPFFFLVAMIYFITGLQRRREPTEVLGKQGARILIPLFAWSGVYMVMMWAKSIATGEARHWDWIGIFLYGQGAVHLYFLAILFWLQVVALGIDQMIQRKRLVVWTTVLAFSGIFAWWGSFQRYLGWGGTCGALLFILIGWAFATWWKPGLDGASGGRIVGRKVTFGVGVALFTGASIIRLNEIELTVFGFDLTPLSGAVGFYLILSSLRLEFSSRFAKRMLFASYGIYLCHFLFVEGIEFLLQKLRILPAVYSWRQEAIFTLVVFMMAFAAVEVIRRFPLSRRIFLGEA